MYHQVIGREGNVILDFSDCYYIDDEGIRWLAATKAGKKAAFADRRRQDRRAGPRPDPGNDKRGGERRDTGARRDRPDRRKRSEF
jgi:hypothetical protein